LYAASENGHTDIVASLLQAGAEVNHHGSRRGTAIRIAAEKGFEPIVELLLRAGSSIDGLDEIHLLTPLMAALDAGHCRIAKRLIESEAFVTFADGHGVTALERAAEYGHIDLLELMFKF
jgi:ankyrin repeat protein